MHRPRHESRVGLTRWLTCDHQGTTVHPATETVRLASVESAETGAPQPALRLPWQLLQGGVLVAECEGHCDEERVWAVPPEGPAQLVRGHSPGTPADGEFSPPASAPLGRLTSLARGARGLGWGVHAAGDVRVVVVIDPTTGTRRAQWTIDGALAAVGTDAGAVVASETTWWRLRDGAWTPLPLEADPSRVLGLAAAGARAFALLRETATAPAQLLVVDADTSLLFELPGLETPLHLVEEPTPDGGVWVSEIEAPPPARTLFTRYEVVGTALLPTETVIARDFDGRAVWWSAEGQLRATRASGEGPAMRSRTPLVAAGTVELPAFESGRLQTTWHRVFVDVCLPPGTSVAVSARADDALYETPRAPTAPAGADWADAAAEHEDRPLGSRSPSDIDGWRDQPRPAVEAHLVDQPLGAGRVAPSLDTLPRGEPRRAPADLVTLEVLLDGTRGRYLWLRLHLFGTGRLSPAIHAVRATHARPSLLDHLPAWWRRDPRQAEAMDRVLSLFEGDYTARHALITALPALFDPRTAPEEALDWLSGFLAIERDQALDEAQRRQLLIDMPELYRRRGTVWAMERLAHIVTGAPARVVEHFRLRGRRAAVIDGSRRVGASVLGEQLHLGVVEPTGPGAFESAIVEARPALEERRDALGCPARLPPLPVATPQARWARATAHHFTVVVFRACDEATRALLDRAIEAAKPAHTLHHLCWADSGMRLDVNARIALGTQLFDPPEPANTVGDAVLATPLAGPTGTGTLVEGAQVGRSTTDGPTKEMP